MTVSTQITLLAALIPAFIGFCAWRRRGNSGARTLWVLMVSLAIWGVVHALEPAARGSVTVDLLYFAEQMALLAMAPLWFAFALFYTGREQWLTRARTALIVSVPLVTLTLVALGSAHEARGLGRLPWRVSFSTLVYGAWSWLDLAWCVFLALAGSALLMVVLLNSQRLYVLQSLCLLVGFLVPWAAIMTHHLAPVEFAFGSYALPCAFALSGLALGWALFRYRLLDLSPLARDALVEGMSDGAIVLDRQGRIADINPAAERILGCEARQVLGRDFRGVMSSRMSPTRRGSRNDALDTLVEQPGQVRKEVRIGEGEKERHYEVLLSSLGEARGGLTAHLVILRENTESKLAVERLDRMARYDALTGLPNRAYFHKRLGEEIARARRRRSPFALLFLDLDGFKEINDALGHGIGDLLLKETARRLQAVLGEDGFASRLAGDEFTVILSGVSEVADAEIAARRIVEALAEPFHLAGNELRVTTSLGISCFPTDATEAATLIKNADVAMYQAKQAGKNRYVLFTLPKPPKAEEPAGHPEWEAGLLRAIDNNELTLFYQPEIELATGRVVGVEALLRWEHPERGLLDPAHFIPLAEEFDLTLPIERWALREACRQVRSWQDRYPGEPPLTVSVSLSSRQFTSTDLVREISLVIEETEIPPGTLILDVPESLLDGDAPSLADTRRSLNDLGVRLAVSGFGIGSFSIAQLADLPLDVLKIGGSFDTGVCHEAGGDRLVPATIGLIRALGYRVVVQGVDSPQRHMRLRAVGCDAAQGSYFAQPLTRLETSAFLASELAGTRMA